MYSDLFSQKSVQDLLTVLPSLPLAVWETFYVTVVSTALSLVIGLPLGVLLVVGEKNGVLPLPRWLMQVLNVIINLLRSIPFLILMIMVFPLSRLLIGTAVGTTATIVPLVAAAFPFVARLVESSLREVDGNIIEAAQSMGATPMQIICKVMIPESVPSLIQNVTIALTTILGYSAMSGIIGGGGLGKIAIDYGYYRYKYLVMLVAVVILVILVQLFQSIGTWLSKKCDKRLKNESKKEGPLRVLPFCFLGEARSVPVKKRAARGRLFFCFAGRSADHALEVSGNGDGGCGSGLHLLHGELGVDLGHQQALGGDFQHAHLGDDLVHAVGSGQGQTALLEDLGVALSGVLHADDAVLGAHAQVHRAAHAGHLLAGDDPVGQIALGVDFQSAQEAGVHVAAADQAEVGGRINEAAAVSHGGGGAAGIHHVIGIVIGVALLGGHTGGDDTQLSVDDHLNALGQIVGDQGGQANAQVHDVAVLQLFGAALGDKAFDLGLFHYFLSPSTM